MILVITGAPGAGKGTIAQIINEELEIKHTSTGDMLRHHVKLKDKIGLRVKSIIDSGKLVSDDLMEEIVHTYLKKLTIQETDCLLDGFPRTVAQAKDLIDFYKVKGVIQVILEDNVIIERLSLRLVCTNCGASYHLKDNPPKKENICDACGHELTHREDDKPDVIKKRLETYHKQTEPILDFLKENNISILQLRGDLDIDTQKDFIVSQVRKLIE